MDLTKIEQISLIATQETSITLSKMLHCPIAVSSYVAEKNNLAGLTSLIPEDSLLAIVTHELTGEVTGHLSLILPNEALFYIADLLTQQKPGSTKEFSEEVKSAAEELSNIVLGNYLQAFSRQMGLTKLLHKAGDLTWGTAQTLSEQTKLRIEGTKAEEACLAILFTFAEKVVKGYVLIILNSEFGSSR